MDKIVCKDIRGTPTTPAVKGYVKVKVKRGYMNTKSCE